MFLIAYFMSVFWQATKIVLHQVEITIFLISFATLVSSSSAWFPFLFFFYEEIDMHLCSRKTEKLQGISVPSSGHISILVY